MKAAHVHFDPARGLLVGTFDDGVSIAPIRASWPNACLCTVRGTDT
jgi:hypothetical protein